MPEFKYVAGKEGIQELWRRIRTEIGKFNSFQPAEAAQDGTPNIALEDRKTNIIYLVEEAGATPPDLYKEWIWTLPEGSEGEWVCIGDTSMDLSDMAKKSEMSVETVQGDPTKKTIQLKTNLAQEVVIEHQDISGKQDVISDLGTIRTGAAAGATAYQKPNTGIPSSDMTATVQASLGKADSAIQHVYAGQEELVPVSQTVTIPYAKVEQPVHEVTIGGRTYHTVTMPDGKEWLAENLDYQFCEVGGSGNPAEAHAWYYNNDQATYGASGRNCGLLYNGYATVYLEEHKDTLLPAGWRVPTSADFSTMLNAVHPLYPARALKGPADWADPQWEYSNVTEFNAVPSGYYSYSGTFGNDTGFCGLMASTATTTEITRYDLVKTDPFVSGGQVDILSAASIRLINDTPVSPLPTYRGGLMTSGMTEKLDGIEAHAEVNVQADWNVSDNTSDAFIKNKPSLATVATSGSYTDLSNTPASTLDQGYLRTYDGHSVYAARTDCDKDGNDITLGIDGVTNTVTDNSGEPVQDSSGNPLADAESDARVVSIGELPIWADRAEKDASGNDIETTYATKQELQDALGDLETILASI